MCGRANGLRDGLQHLRAEDSLGEGGGGGLIEDGEAHVGLEPQVRACGGELLAVPVEVGLGILDGRDGVRRLGDARKDGTHMGGRAASCSCQ